MPYTLVLIRHGESTWNEKNLFTGWTDVDLSQKGMDEALQAAQLLNDAKLRFDLAFTSVLKRAVRTLWTILDKTDQMHLPVVRHWRLNERMYGALQGLDKAETARKYGDEQVTQWRRSYDIPPPELDPADPKHPLHMEALRSVPRPLFPNTESLKDTLVRVLPYWCEVIEPEVKAGKRVVIVAHGNSLRALVKYLDNVSEKEIVELNIPTALPLVYELDERLKPIRHYYLGDATAAAAKAAAVAAQAKAKK